MHCLSYDQNFIYFPLYLCTLYISANLSKFQAFRRHALHDPLSEPGTADLTADVDFSYLKKMVHGKGKKLCICLF